MTKRGSLNAQRCLCAERDVPEAFCVSEGWNVGFMRCSAGRWPEMCQPDNHHHSAQHEHTDFLLRFLNEPQLCAGFCPIKSYWLKQNWNFTLKFRKEWHVSSRPSLLFYLLSLCSGAFNQSPSLLKYSPEAQFSYALCYLGTCSTLHPIPPTPKFE